RKRNRTNSFSKLTPGLEHSFKPGFFIFWGKGSIGVVGSTLATNQNPILPCFSELESPPYFINRKKRIPVMELVILNHNPFVEGGVVTFAQAPFRSDVACNVYPSAETGHDTTMPSGLVEKINV